MKRRISTADAAALIPCQPSTLKKSRHTGELFGVPSPAFLKLGRRVFYDADVIDEWLSQFDSYENTSQYQGGEA